MREIVRGAGPRTGLLSGPGSWTSISKVTPAPIDISIGGDGIRLGQFLKFAGLLDSGGDVKEAIIDGYVTVNGEVDRRRGRQLQLGDVVTFEGRSVRVCP